MIFQVFSASAVIFIYNFVFDINRIDEYIHLIDFKTI